MTDRYGPATFRHGLATGRQGLAFQILHTGERQFGTAGAGAPMADPPTIWENVVRFDETDLHGHVFYGEFFTYMDETFTELLRRVDYPYRRMHREGWTTNVVHAELDYLAPATLGDHVENRMRIESIGERSLTASYEAHSSGETLTSGEVVHVAVEFGEGDSGGAITLPDSFREVVTEFQDRSTESD